MLYDYVRTILDLNRTQDKWILDPRVGGPSVYANDGTPMGIGNQVSLEFNLVYRWHSAVSDRDDKWTQGFIKKVFPGKDISKMSVTEFILGVRSWLASIDSDPAKRNLDGDTILRDPKTGQFKDEDLIKILTESTEDCAGILPVVLTKNSCI